MFTKTRSILEKTHILQDIRKVWNTCIYACEPECRSYSLHFCTTRIFIQLVPSTSRTSTTAPLIELSATIFCTTWPTTCGLKEHHTCTGYHRHHIQHYVEQVATYACSSTRKRPLEQVAELHCVAMSLYNMPYCRAVKSDGILVWWFGGPVDNLQI